MFYEPSQFEFVRDLEIAWRDILQEFCQVCQQVEAWSERELYDHKWDVYRIFDFPHGEPIAVHVESCPATTRVVEKCFPHHGVAGFSVLGPQTTIHPHAGYQGPYLRCHLALRVPAGNCQLEVAGERRQWVAGKAVIFDDRVTHAAWNLTNESRAVLLVDFVPEK